MKIQSVPRSKHSPSVIKTSQLMLYREIIAVCSQIHTKHINTLCGQNVELLNVKLAVRIVTTGDTSSDHWALQSQCHAEFQLSEQLQSHAMVAPVTQGAAHILLQRCTECTLLREVMRWLRLTWRQRQKIVWRFVITCWRIVARRGLSIETAGHGFGGTKSC